LIVEEGERKFKKTAKTVGAMDLFSRAKIIKKEFLQYNNLKVAKKFYT
jgi:hypothetical protein